MSHYTELGHDLEAALARYTAQENAGSSEDRGSSSKECMRGTLLSSNHPDALRLSDGEPVTARSADKAAGFFCYEGSHVFPTERELVRFASKVAWPLERLVALALKGAWEHHVAAVSRYPSNNEALRDMLGDALTSEKLRSCFKPDVASLFRLLDEHNHLARANGYDEDTFGNLVGELLANDLHLVANDSAELSIFAKRVTEERAAISDAVSQQREEFWMLKATRLGRWEELGDIALEIEDRKVEQAHTVAEWRCRYGDAELAVTRELERCRLAAMAVELKEGELSLTAEDIETRMLDAKAESARSMGELEFDLAIGKCSRPSADGRLVDGDALSKYQRQCKKAALKVLFLIHPDRLEHNPAYHVLTSKQKAILQELHTHASRIRSGELGYDAGQVGYANRDLMALNSSIATIERILEEAGIDLNVDLPIRGTTVSERIGFLKKDIDWLESCIDTARGDLVQLVENATVREYSWQLAMPEQEDTIRSALMAEAERHARQADKLEAHLASLFADQDAWDWLKRIA